MSAVIGTPEPGAIARAAARLRAGELVAFPTETVYGLGADAGSRGRGAPHLRREGPTRRSSGHRSPVRHSEARALGAFRSRGRTQARRRRSGRGR